MLPVCSTTANYCWHSHSQVCLYAGCRHFSYNKKAFSVRCIVDNGAIWRLSNKICLQQQLPFKTQATTYLPSSYVSQDQHLSSLKFADPVIQETSSLLMPVDLRNTVAPDVIMVDPTSASDSFNMDIDSEYLSKTDAKDVFAGINESLGALVCNIDTAISNSFKIITSSVEIALKGANEAVDTSLGKLKFAFNSTLSGLSNNSKEASSKALVVAIDALRDAIIKVEESLTQGGTLVVSAYASTKDMLPPEFQNVLTSSEERTLYILKPVGTTFQQVYIALEGLEKSLGIDPNDPVVPFVLVLGTSATLWISYWILNYGGYAGDLSPRLTLELLNGKESVALIDVRPEDFRERDGIPDLRRTARFRYATVTLPEVDAYVKKLLKSGKDLDDTLVAAVIRNLKIVQDRSKVIVMDADGTRSKGIARSLRKLGIKKPYLVQGGFRSWVQEGMRIKEAKPETTLTILNEEAEAILEDTTPLQVIGYGVGFLAAAYALLEWEKTLQLIAVVGIVQTIYRRVASYEDSQDFNRDVRQLLVPVKLGSQAISWAAGKLETNRNGLPTSPSSVDVQNRVLQAAAKHESQPPDGEESQDIPPDSTSTMNQNADLSEA